MKEEINKKNKKKNKALYNYKAIENVCLARFKFYVDK